MGAVSAGTVRGDCLLVELAVGEEVGGVLGSGKVQEEEELRSLRARRAREVHSPSSSSFPPIPS